MAGCRTDTRRTGSPPPHLRKSTMDRIRYEYRVNKKGAECFRTEIYEEAKARLEDLKAKKPNVKFDMQRRYVYLDKHGLPRLDYLGRPQWTPWF